jgi:hypothetical protein
VTFILQKRGKVKEVEVTTETPYPKKKEIKPKNPQTSLFAVSIDEKPKTPNYKYLSIVNQDIGHRSLSKIVILVVEKLLRRLLLELNDPSESFGHCSPTETTLPFFAFQHQHLRFHLNLIQSYFR